MKIKAFTFIELLVVVIIIILISSAGVFYFFGFLDQSKLNLGVNYINDELENLDKKVKRKDLTDYEIFLKKDSLFFITKENTLNLSNVLVFSGGVDFYTGSGKLYLKPLGNINDALFIKIYANDKFLKDFIVEGNSKTDIGFSKFQNYKVSGTYSGQILNDVEIKYFSESNLDKKRQDYLKLVKISTNKTSNLDSIYVKNILGIKNFSDNPNSTKLYLTFEVNGKQKILEINK